MERIGIDTLHFSCCLALPLGELSPQVTERVLQTWSLSTLSVFASLRHLSQRERQGTHKKGIFYAYLSNPRGKDPRKPKRFSWSVQGSLRGNRNPLRLVFFLPLFLLEKQKKKWVGSCKFAEEPQPYSRPHLPVSPQKQLTTGNPGISKRKSAVFLHIVYKSFTILKKKGSIISIFKYERK